MKHCSDCKTNKPTSEFSKNKNTKDGYCYRCRSCQSIRCKDYYAKNKSKYVKRNADRRQAKKALVAKHKDKPCTDCGIKYPYWVMQFDHVRGTKRFGINRGLKEHPVKSILEEIKKCEIVCSNCHADRTYQRLLKP